MKQWDGIAGDLLYIYGDELYKDEKSGAIYFKDSNGAFCIWCAAEKLREHLHRLYQITRSSAHDEAIKKHIVYII